MFFDGKRPVMPPKSKQIALQKETFDKKANDDAVMIKKQKMSVRQ
jgi:hypothetical protein